MTVRLMQGNAACVEGALRAGCRFFAGYPITPSSEIAELLAQKLPPLGGKFIQMEDEIASLAAVIGASVGGLKAMTATSGPGFSLMQENLGYAAATEIPCVIVDVQRAGPSTGLPTAPSQGDVMQARWGTHGDHPIIALYPSSVSDVYLLTIEAFNFSESYRTPVILLMDEVIGHMREPFDSDKFQNVEIIDRMTTDVPPEWYFPYDETRAVPPLVSFGEGFRYHITGLFHDRAGFPTERKDEIEPWWRRIFAKINDNIDRIFMYEEDGVRDARTIVIAFGATARSAAHAVQLARRRRYKVGLITLKTIWPFHESLIEELTANAHRVIVPEMNLGQMALEVERVLGRSKVRRVNRVDGELIEPRQILEAIEVA
ncbi:MAG: 2-oxoacid:acceptor oxidoreductase subunit alpha [Chloroflexi bacterium]|nr:2-oxoacid:acceptor oxidoreductase subunit alpha [Chloroflexota bacterium]